MATYINTFDFDMSVGTNFRTFMSPISTQIQSFGWVQTSDTGQINLATATYPGLSTFAGYQVFQTNDGLTTWYVRIDFGVSAATTRPSVKFTLGTSTNGAGTIGGQTANQTIQFGNTNSGTHFVFMSGNAGRFMFYMGDANANNNNVAGISIYRTVDGTGAPTSTGMEYWYIKDNLNSGQQFIPASGTIPGVEAWRVIFTTNTTAVIGTTTRTAHPVTWGETTTNNPTLAVAVFATSDFAVGTSNTTTITLYGGTHTYVLTAQAVFGNNGKGMWLFE